jgi:ankyrin repeat protein
MQTNPIARSLRWIIPIAALLTPSVRAEEPSLRDLLRDGLFAEEVTRDSEAAAKQYEQVLARYSEQRAFAASALFRLAEVRRKQDRKDDAIQLYQRLLAEFPGAAIEAKLARENLAALGGKPAESAPAQGDEESKQLSELQAAAQSSPDVLLDPQTLNHAVLLGRVEVVKFLLAAGSPRYEGKALQNAAETGNLEIVKLLLASGGPVPERVATEAIMKAIGFRRHAILDFMLKAGLKPGRLDHDSTVLSEALIADPVNWAAVDVLLKNGVSIDEIVDPPELRCDSSGTALGKMVALGYFESAAGLLERRANPNIPDLFWGRTPLHAATWGRTPGTLEMMGKLIDGGADLNQISLGNIKSEDFSERHGSNVTPLESAIGSDTFVLEKTKLLLKHGAKLDRKGSRVADMLVYQMTRSIPDILELVKLLGEAGFRMDSGELLKAVLEKNSKVLPLLMKYGANPKLDSQVIELLLERNQPDSMEHLKLLVNAGARPDATWMKNNMEKGRGEVRDFLVEKFTLPSFFNEAEIQLVMDDPFGIKNSNIAVRSGDAAPPDLGAWLLANHQNSQWAQYDSDPLIYQWRIWRKGEEGVMTKQVVDFSGDAPIPPLLWGDIVECRITFRPGGSGCSGRKGLPPQEVAKLRRRIAFPITFEIDGTSREITVRGDRVVFDPTKNEVPLANLQIVLGFLWQPGQYPSFLPTIHLTRKGWPDVRLSYGSKEAEKFQLQAGDRVSLEISEQVRADLAAKRRETVTLKVAGYPFAKSFGTTVGGKPVAASIPTLIQALVDTQVPWSRNWKDLAKSKNLDLAALSAESGPFTQFSLLTHPDLANLRIRRLQEDGGEKVIDVNLEKIITASTDQTTPEEARKADVMLQMGDVVEVSLLKDRLAEPWKGFAAREETFFAKALSGRVRMTAKDGSMSVRDLVFQAPRFQETEIGWIPLPPETGIPSMRGSWLSLDQFMLTKREAQESSLISPYEVFLRDGDDAVLTDTRPRQLLPQPQVFPPPSR